MKVNFPNSQELLETAHAQDLYERLVEQLLKDFNLANVPIDFSLDVEIADLKATLHEKVYYLILERFMDYLNLLYVVDVPEHAFKEISAVDVVEVAEQVSFLILKREWQKVWFKSKYAS
ncbi:hypothetical protein WIW50_02605 [Flavobacteriaceae bacterium 3-367]|uniref:hypothetical protein n=1 Tax=Eudoraea algarum TaxID=3417568 RepID=UPI0032684D95